jgi:hypothetical protein
MLSHTVGLPFMLKVFISIILIALPGFFMGMPFPTGLKLTDRIDKANVPWAWGINACISVISTAPAALIAVEFGFKTVLIVSVSAYIIAFFSNFLIRNSTALD